MRLNKRFFVAAVSLTLAVTMIVGAQADTVVRNHPLDGQNQIYLRLNGSLQANIIDQNQGNVCHGINVSSYSNTYTPLGATIDYIESDANRTIYLFTGPTCDGFAHVAYSGQLVAVSNSNNTSNQVLVKSYYFR